MNCIFCKIIAGDIPSAKLYEDDDVIAILDISQETKGHTLVMPKTHYANVLEIPEDLYIKVMTVAKSLAKKITSSLKSEGCNIITNCGEVAGQTVMHFHVHILPRYEDDNFEFHFNDNSALYNLKDIQNEILSGK